MNQIFGRLCGMPDFHGKVLCQVFPDELASLEKESARDAYHFSYESMVQISASVCGFFQPLLHAHQDLKVIVFTDSTLDRKHAGKESVANVANRLCDRVRFLTVGGSTLCVKDKRFLEMLWALFTSPRRGLPPTAGITGLWNALDTGNTRYYRELVYPSESRVLRNRREMRKQYLTEPWHLDAGPFVSALQGAQEAFIREGM